MGAPWLNYNAHIQTIIQNDMFGIMLTTWHTLRKQIHSILGCAKNCGAVTFPWSHPDTVHGQWLEVSTMWRRISFEGNSYSDSGWSKEQMEV